MNRYLAAMVLASVILLAGCTGQQAATDDAPDTGDSQPVSCDGVDGETHTVMYGSDGFSPQQITIQRCDTVQWQSQGPEMWVGSDVHPTHTEYDGTGLNQHCPNDGDAFDQCSTGNTYSFTFEQAGSFGYHNHERAAHGGTVTVQER